MNNTKRAILAELGKLIEYYPQQRVGQIISNYIMEETPMDIFYIKDEDLLKVISNSVIQYMDKIIETEEKRKTELKDIIKKAKQELNHIQKVREEREMRR